MIIRKSGAYPFQLRPVPHVFRIIPRSDSICQSSLVKCLQVSWNDISLEYLSSTQRIRIQVVPPAQVDPLFNKIPSPLCNVFLEHNIGEGECCSSLHIWTCEIRCSLGCRYCTAVV